MSTRGQDNGRIAHGIRPIAMSVLVGAVCCALVLLLMAALMAAVNVPQFAVDPMASFALMAGGFAAGFSCAKIMREKGLVYGAICGVLLSLLVVLAGLAINDRGFGIPALFKVAFTLFSSMLGGVLGVNARRRKRR